MKFGLKPETIEKINSVFIKHPEVEEVIIYGSRAKGNYRNGSDIDITLKGESLIDSILSKVSWDIDDLNTPYLFDISIFSKLNSPDLEEHINRVGKVFYQKNTDKRSITYSSTNL
ncbi:MAG: nucleotidyltransferase domain-containing protein [Janthinobacterium lividum]